jgi:hypothetical protein
VTRAADIIDTTDMSWFNPSAGSFYVSSLVSHFSATLGIVMDVSDNSASDRIYIQRSAAENPGQLTLSASALQSALASGAYQENVVMRMASRYALNDVEFYVQGARVGTGDQAAALPIGLSKLTLGNNFAGTEAFNGWLQEVAYFDTSLTLEELALLSTDGTFPLEGAGVTGPGLAFGTMGRMGA